METDRPKELICQSCGMPLRKEEDFGTNADASMNGEYCHFCFNDGKFTEPNITMKQKIEKVVQIATSQMNMSEPQARKMAHSVIPKLKRWQNK